MLYPDSSMVPGTQHHMVPPLPHAVVPSHVFPLMQWYHHMFSPSCSGTITCFPPHAVISSHVFPLMQWYPPSHVFPLMQWYPPSHVFPLMQWYHHMFSPSCSGTITCFPPHAVVPSHVFPLMQWYHHMFSPSCSGTITCFPPHAVVPSHVFPLMQWYHHMFSPSCSGTHHHKSCNEAQQAKVVRDLLTKQSSNLFPSQLTLDGGLYPGASRKRVKPYGGWGDIRDHQLCMNFTQKAAFFDLKLPT